MTEEQQKTSSEDDDTVRSVEAKKGVRNQLENDIEAFLASGGNIEEVDNNISADPPTKPVSRYGGRPI